MWQDIIDWCVISYEEFKSETLVFLYYDLNTKENAWSFWIPPQITNGMTVKSNPESEFFADERKNFPDTMFGTVHHHCSSSAFQSGTDHSDELDREGLHFTVGHCNKTDDLDLHLRMTIGNAHSEIEADNVIEADPKLQSAYKSLSTKYQPTKVKEALDVLHGSSIRSASNNYKSIKKFNKHFKKVTKPVTYTKPYKPRIGFGIDDNQLSWDMHEPYLKKIEPYELDDYATFDEIADDVIYNCIQDNPIEDIRLKYLQDYKQEICPSNMYIAEPKEITENTIDMLEDMAFLETSDGIKFKETIELYLKTKWADYVVSLTDLVDGLKEMLQQLKQDEFAL